MLFKVKILTLHILPNCENLYSGISITISCVEKERERVNTFIKELGNIYEKRKMFPNHILTNSRVK